MYRCIPLHLKTIFSGLFTALCPLLSECCNGFLHFRDPQFNMTSECNVLRSGSLKTLTLSKTVTIAHEHYVLWKK